MCHRPMYCDNSNDDEHCVHLQDNLVSINLWPAAAAAAAAAL